MKDIDRISLIDLMPEAIRKDPQIKAICEALDRELRKINEETKEILYLPRLDELSEEVLDLLAWQWHVDFYDSVNLDLSTKRKLIKNSILDHRIKGTPAAIEKLFANVFNGAQVKEWFEYDGEPYHFKIEAIGRQIASEEQLFEFKHALESTKNERSWLDEVKILLSNILEMFIGAHLHKYTGIKQHLEMLPESQKFTIYHAIIPFESKIIHFKPVFERNQLEFPNYVGLLTAFQTLIKIPIDPADEIQHRFESTSYLTNLDQNFVLIQNLIRNTILTFKESFKSKIYESAIINTNSNRLDRAFANFSNKTSWFLKNALFTHFNINIDESRESVQKSFRYFADLFTKSIALTLEKVYHSAIEKEIFTSSRINSSSVLYIHRKEIFSEQAPWTFEESLDLAKIEHTRTRITVYLRGVMNGES